MRRDDASPVDDPALAVLFEALQADPPRHDFFAVLRQVEALRPHAPRWGRALRPAQEALRLGQDAELDFAPAALQSFEPTAGGVPRLGVRFFGLLGPQGPAPLHLTEYVRERLRYRADAGPARFLDIFHHRLLALFYRAWAQAQPVVQADRPHDDRFAAWLGASVGVHRSTDDAAFVPPAARLFQAGLLGSRSRHPEGLAKLIEQHFGVPVRVEQHVPQWLALAAADRTRLGFARHRAEGAAVVAAQAGRSATAGWKRCDRQYRFRIALGPLTLARYLDFLPGSRAWRTLCEWVRLYAGLDLRWDVRLVLARGELPEPRLGRVVRLGISTWIGRVDRTRDREDLRLPPEAAFATQQGADHA